MQYDKYHPDWKDVIRPLALKQAQYKCAVCSIQNKSRVYLTKQLNYVICDDFIEDWAKAQGFKVFTIYLQVAHLDHNKSNNSLNNLRVLCPRHHALMDAQHKKMLRNTLKAVEIPTFTKFDVLELSKLKECIAALQIAVKEITKVKITASEADSIIQSISKYL